MSCQTCAFGKKKRKIEDVGRVVQRLQRGFI